MCALYPVQAYTIKQSSSKHRTDIEQANVEQLEHTLCTCILNAFAGCLLDDCSMFDDRVNGYHNNIRRGLRQSD